MRISHALTTPNGRCFLERATLYRAWDHRLGERTRFFAAAAWINELIPHLVTFALLGKAASRLLAELGDVLLTKNTQLFALISAQRIALSPPQLDCWLVEQEQKLVETILKSHDAAFCYEACRDIDHWLNSPWLKLSGRWLPGPVASISQLAQAQPLTFANRWQREAIGMRICAQLQRGTAEISLRPQPPSARVN